MKSVHPALVAIAALILALGLCAAVGCSCKESDAPEPQVVKVARPEPRPAAPERPAEPAGPAAPAGRERQPGDSLLHTPGDYLYTVTVTAPRYARKSVSLSVLQNDIQQYRAANGRYPASLAELSAWSERPTPEAPAGQKYMYDPQTGKLELVPTNQ